MTDYVQWRAFDRVALKDRVADQLLRDAIATLDVAGGASVRSFPVRDAGAEAMMVAHVVPIRLSARDIFVRCAAALVSTPVTLPQAPPVELVQSLFDLTLAEAGRTQPRCRRNGRGHRLCPESLAKYNSHACAWRVGKDRLQPPSRHRRPSLSDFLDAADELDLARRHSRKSQ